MTQPLDIAGDKQLFIDGYCIGELSGVRLQLNQPTKHPANPLLEPKMPWEDSHIQVYGNALYDTEAGHYRMWYSARSSGPNNSKVDHVCHATSTDGVHWERSQLDVYPQDGKPSNVVLQGQYIGPTVFHTPDDPDPQRRYRMFAYMGPELLNDDLRKAAFKHGYGVLFSPDGFHWTEYENNPVIQGGDISTCSYDPVTKDYIAFPKIPKSDDGIGRRCTGWSLSKDFMSWTTPEIILSADTEDDARTEARLERFRNVLTYDDAGPLGHPSADIYGTTGFRYEGLRLGLMWFYDKSCVRRFEFGGNDDGVMNIQLASQREGENWKRAADRKDFLACGKEGDYDSAMVITAHTVVEVADELWFYYSGFDRSHYVHGDGNLPDRPRVRTKTPCRRSHGSRTPGCDSASINLAILRRDGFISIDALYPEGSVTTKLLTFKGSELEINADAERGHIIVEIQDEDCTPIPGFTRADCVPFTQDAVHGKVQWHGGKSVAELQGKPVRITFFVQTAKLYAFKFI